MAMVGRNPNSTYSNPYRRIDDNSSRFPVRPSLQLHHPEPVLPCPLPMLSL